MSTGPCSRKLLPFGESIFTHMTRLANQHGAVNLSQGFPDFDGPDWLKEAACEAIRRGPNQYAPSAGAADLRQALHRKMLRDYRLDYHPETEITVTSGATEALFATLQGLLDPGDEVLLLEPYYDSYPACVVMAGGIPRYLPMRGDGFRLDPDELERAVTPATRLLMLNSPNNPTGKVFTQEELDRVADLAVRRDLVVVSDEVYEHLVFEPEVHRPLASFPGMRERTVTISSISKTMSMTGWKVGWAMAPSELTRAVRSAKQFITFCSVAPLQNAVAATLDRLPELLPAQVAEYRRRRDALTATLEEFGLTVRAPAGTYFIVADIRPVTRDDDLAFCERLTRERGVAAIPCSAFYHDRQQVSHLVRFAFCKNLATLEEARRRLLG
ncbi:MAG: aminotransferase class I/II-fold pyridoxal phosphate-dependent enzyme [Candidatus Eremiobacterota bacterium]